MYEDGTEDFFCGARMQPRAGTDEYSSHRSHEWQQDGFLRPGVIVGIRPAAHRNKKPQKAARLELTFVDGISVEGLNFSGQSDQSTLA